MDVGIFGLTGCAGDQLAIINCEDELLKIASRVHFASFEMAASGDVEENARYDLAIVEGSVCQPRDLAILEKVRGQSAKLLALGTCAVYGGLPATKAELPAEQLKRQVYGKEGEAFEVMRAQPLSAFVKVDFELPGCPVEKHEVLETVSCLLKGQFPEFPPIPVCTECRLKENLCRVLEEKEVCCGALTRGGCGARCPSLGLTCIGCHGPLKDAYMGPRDVVFKPAGITREDIRQRLLLFSTPAALAQRLEKERP